MKTNLVKIPEELLKNLTRNMIANYEKYRTLHEYNRNLRSITQCDKSIVRILNNPIISPLSRTDRQQHRESGRVALHLSRTRESLCGFGHVQNFYQIGKICSPAVKKLGALLLYTRV